MSLTERVAAHFTAHPGVWIDMHTLAQIGGTGGWRTRVSDCRRELGMTIENRTRRTQDEMGRHWTVSEYRYVPPAPPAHIQSNADDRHLLFVTMNGQGFVFDADS